MMFLPKLSPRLKLVAQLIRPGGLVADIGTDHAYIPVMLVKSGHNPRVYACDIGSGPLECAARTLERFGAQDKVKLLKTDGLDGVAYADDVVIAGMGGELIETILARCGFIRDPQVALVLQPMTAVPELSLFLCRNGFEIKKEIVTKEGQKLYIAISAGYCGRPFEPDELFLLIGFLAQTGGALEREYIRRESIKFYKMAAGLKKSKDRAGEALRAGQIAAALNVICEKMTSV